MACLADHADDIAREEVRELLRKYRDKSPAELGKRAGRIRSVLWEVWAAGLVFDVGTWYADRTLPSSVWALTAFAKPLPAVHDARWWGNRKIPTGWESGQTVDLAGGKVVSCSPGLCQYSVQSLTVQPAAAGHDSTAVVVLFTHDGDGTALGQTVMVLTVAHGGVLLEAASDTAVWLGDRSLCRPRATLASDDEVDEVYTRCPDPAMNGTQHWSRSGARLSTR